MSPETLSALSSTLLCAGALLVVGVIVYLASGRSRRRRQRILDTPTSRITDAPGGGLVEIKGVAVPSEQGVVTGPFSGVPGVYVRVRVLEYRRSGKSGRWVTVLDETDGREFFVDDGSGQLCRIFPVGAVWELELQQIARSGTFHDPPPHLEGFLQSRGLTSTTFLGFNRNLRYEETVIHSGTPVYALGPSARVPGPPSNDGYRTVASTMLVMQGGFGDANELTLTNKTEEQLVRRLHTGTVASYVIFALSGVVAVFALANALANLL